MAVDEIVDMFDRSYSNRGEMFMRGGELLDWGSLYGRRRLLVLLSAIAGTPAEPVAAKANWT